MFSGAAHNVCSEDEAFSVESRYFPQQQHFFGCCLKTRPKQQQTTICLPVRQKEKSFGSRYFLPARGGFGDRLGGACYNTRATQLLCGSLCEKVKKDAKKTTKNSAFVVVRRKEMG